MRFVVLAAVGALLVAGCGSSGSGSGGDGGAKTASKSPKVVFQGTCGSCHTLKDAGTSGSFGPNLDQLKPDKSTVRTQIEKGGGGMPANLLQGAQADAVSGYVASAAGK